jgi:hypothetical protein
MKIRRATKDVYDIRIGPIGIYIENTETLVNVCVSFENQHNERIKYEDVPVLRHPK